MEKLENDLWAKVIRVRPFLEKVPFVRMIAVCNNLSFGMVDKKSDIDLFVVAKSGRLFFVRMCVTFLLQILGVRRHGNKVAGRFCLSFFVDDSALSLSKISLKNDIYLAFWLCYLVPIVCDDLIVDELWEKNGWIRKFFTESDFVVRRGDLVRRKSWAKSVMEFLFGGFVGNFLEKILMKWQLKRAKAKAALVSGGSLIINEHMLKFHNIDRRREYRGRWYKMYGESSLTLERLERVCF